MKDYLENSGLLSERAFLKESCSLEEEAQRFIPTAEMKKAMNLAIDQGRPLLIRGNSSTFNMCIPAYYAAYKMRLGGVFHYRVRQSSKIDELLYQFDKERYVYDLQTAAQKIDNDYIDKAMYIMQGIIWTAMEKGHQKGEPAVLLIEGIDKASPEFADDLLFELDLMEFRIIETGQIISSSIQSRPITFITCFKKDKFTNSFLSRCELFEFNERQNEQKQLLSEHERSESSIFLSYARDDIDIVRRLSNDLSKREFDVWLDEEKLLPGQKWEDEIREAIKKCSYFIALISNNSVSKKGYVHKELKIALDILDESPHSDVFIIPVRVEDCTPKDEALQSLHWADLFNDYEKGLTKIIRVMNAHL